MMGLGMPELLVILLLLMLMFGPSQLPKISRALGDTVRELRGVAKEANKP